MKQEHKPATVLVPCPAVLVSVGNEMSANIITLSWVANVCSKPPQIAIGVRPQRHSFGLLGQIGDFVVNVPSEDLLEAVVTCGTKSGRSIDKFTTCNLTPEPSSKVTSPRIKECPLNIECKTRQVVELGAHHLFVGEVLTWHIDEAVLDAEGEPDLAKMKLFTYNPLVGQYWSLSSHLQGK
jgi:flavin reductase (DIM6/NTAB) family NADH-FMN oxidoreductase RutF